MANENLRIIILGGSIYALSIASKIKRINGNASVTIIENSDITGTNPIVLPLIASGEIKNDCIVNEGEEKSVDIYDINIIKKYKISEINKDKKEITLKSLENSKTIHIPYDKLLLTCSYKNNPVNEYSKKFINVFSLNDQDDASDIFKYIEMTSAKKIVLVGVDYLSIIAANSYIKQGFNVTLIDRNETFLENFDKEFDYLIKDELRKSGLNLYSNVEIKDFIKSDKEKIAKIKLSNNTIIEAHIIILFDTNSLNIDLAVKCGLEIKNKASIKVNNIFQTSDPDIFAIGNIIETYNHILKNYEKINLTYNDIYKQVRVVTLNILGIETNYNGLVENTLIILKNKAFASIGLNSSKCKRNSIEFLDMTLYTGSHERFIPGVRQLHIKILVNKSDRKILGAQACGELDTIIKKIDPIIMAIQSDLRVDDLMDMDFLYSPEINTLKDPLNILGMIASVRLDGHSNSVNVEDIKFDQNSFIIDVRNEKDFDKSHVEHSICIPLKDIRKRQNEIPKDKKIYVYGHTGQEGYIAERILRGSGFPSVYSIDGGINSIKLYENII